MTHSLPTLPSDPDQRLHRIREQGYLVTIDTGGCTISNPGRSPSRHIHCGMVFGLGFAVTRAVERFEEQP